LGCCVRRSRANIIMLHAARWPGHV
jgi:hypothetical protein